MPTAVLRASPLKHATALSVDDSVKMFEYFETINGVLDPDPLKPHTHKHTPLLPPPPP